MKGFFVAAIASFLGGVLVLLFQSYFDVGGPNSETSQVSVSSHTMAAPITLSDIEKMRDWHQSFPEYLQALHKNDEVDILQYDIENIGKKDIENFSIELKSRISGVSDVFLYAKTSEPLLKDQQSDLVAEVVGKSQSKWVDVTISNKKIVNFQIPLLKISEAFSLIVAVLPNNIIDSSVRTKDVLVEENKLSITPDSDNWSILDILGYFGISLAAFFLGIAISEYFHREIMKKIGFDYDEIIKLYKEAESKNA